jgi:hypothetical protein
MPASRPDHAAGAAAACRRAKHTRKAVAADIQHRERLARGDISGPPIGSIGVCWCGQPRDHDWPGKPEGEAHPR